MLRKFIITYLNEDRLPSSWWTTAIRLECAIDLFRENGHKNETIVSIAAWYF